MLEGLGHSVEQDHPVCALDDAEYIAPFLVRWTAGVAWTLKSTGKARNRDSRSAPRTSNQPPGHSPESSGARTPRPDYLRAVEYHQLVSRRIASWWDDGFDLLLTPTTAEPATLLGSFEAPPDQPAAPIMRAHPARDLHRRLQHDRPARDLAARAPHRRRPACGRASSSPPTGGEDLLIRVARRLERAEAWRQRWPALEGAPAQSGAGD